jgi:hypothetical protein
MLFLKDKTCIFQSTINTVHYSIPKLPIIRAKLDHVRTMESNGCRNPKGKKSLKIQKGLSKDVNQRAGNTIAK